MSALVETQVSGVLIFVVAESGVLLYQWPVGWGVVGVLLVSLLGGLAGLANGAAALLLGYWAVWAYGRAHRAPTYRNWVVWAVVLVVLAVLYWGAQEVIPTTGFPLGRVRAWLGFLALAGFLYYDGRTRTGVGRLWVDVHHYDAAHLYWVLTVTIFTLAPRTTPVGDLVVVAALVLSVAFIRSLLYRK